MAQQCTCFNLMLFSTTLNLPNPHAGLWTFNLILYQLRIHGAGYDPTLDLKMPFQPHVPSTSDLEPFSVVAGVLPNFPSFGHPNQLYTTCQVYSHAVDLS